MVNAIVYPWPDEDIESTLKRLRRVLEKSGYMKEYRRHKEYVPRSQRRRSKIAAAVLRRYGAKARVRAR